MKDSIIQQALRVAYDQTLDQISISQGHKVVSHKHAIKFQTNQKRVQREIKTNTLSLEAYDLYIFSPFGNKLPKSS